MTNVQPTNTALASAVIASAVVSKYLHKSQVAHTLLYRVNTPFSLAAFSLGYFASRQTNAVVSKPTGLLMAMGIMFLAMDYDAQPSVELAHSRIWASDRDSVGDSIPRMTRDPPNLHTKP